MTYQEDIEAIKSRIVKAEFQRDTWRAAGREEKYLAAYFAVEALTLQLDERLRAAPPPFVDTEATWQRPG